MAAPPTPFAASSAKAAMRSPLFRSQGHRKLVETASLERGCELAERISGDSSVAHALAFCQAVEAVADVMIPPRAPYLRVVLLELERLYNHIENVGAICTDTGFAVANTHALRLREEVLRLNARITGHRLLRGALALGGGACKVTSELSTDARKTLARVIADFDEVVEIALSNGMRHAGQFAS